MIDGLLKPRSPWRDKFELWVAQFMDLTENSFRAFFRVIVPTPTIYFQRFVALTAMEILFSEYSIFFLLKFLQINYSINNFLLIFGFGWIIPFMITNGRVLLKLECPKSPLGFGQAFVWASLVLLAILCQFTYNNIYVTIVFVTAAWPPLLLFLSMSLMHLNTRVRVQFAATRDFPLLGILGVLGSVFSIVGLKNLTFLDCITMMALDGLWAAIFACIILGQERRNLHRKFTKSYVAQLCFLSFYLLGESTSTPPIESILYFFTGRICLIIRCLYVKWSYIRFSGLAQIITPPEFGPKDVLLGPPPKEKPKAHLFEKFPPPVLEHLDVLWDSGLVDDCMHGAGKLGTTDLYMFTDYQWSLPWISVFSIFFEFNRLPFGIFPPWQGYNGGAPKGSMMEEMDAEKLKWEGIDQIQERSASEDNIVCVACVLVIMFICLIRPLFIGRKLFDHGSSVHSIPMKPFLIVAPFFAIDIIWLEKNVSRLQIIFSLILFLIYYIYRRGLYLAYRRKVVLLQTSTLRFMQPSILRSLQAIAMRSFLQETSTEDYSYMLLESSISRGTVLRTLARQTGLQAWDPRPSARAAWKLSVSLVRKAIRKQKREETFALKSKVNVIMGIQDWIYEMADEAVDEADGHGKRLQLSQIYAKQMAKRNAFKRLRNVIKERKTLRANKKSGSLATAPVVIATAGGVLRTLDTITVPPPIIVKEGRENGIFFLCKNVQKRNLPTPHSLVYCFGDNSFNQLGDNKEGKVMTVDILRGKDLVQVEAGLATSIFLGSKGKVQGFGSNRSLNLGLRKDIVQADTLHVLKSFRDLDITQISSGTSGHGHGLALAQSGKVYGFGTSHYGALGLGPEVKQTLPKLISMTEKIPIKYVATGVKHSMLLTNTGQVYTFGENNVGQLGVGRKKENGWRWVTPYIDTPQLIELRDVSYIAAGDAHSCAITKIGVWAWGANQIGQLGLGHNEDQYSPKMLTLENAESVACGSNHTIFQQPQSLWVTGSNSHRQIGLDGEIKMVNVPTLMTTIKDPTTVVCAGDHSCVIDKRHKLWIFGCNDNGQLGFPASERKVVPKPEILVGLKRCDVYQVSTSETHTIVLGAGFR